VKYYNKWPASADVIPYTSITYKEIGSITSFQPKLKQAKEHVQSTEAWGYDVHAYSLGLVKGTDVECRNM